LGTPEVSSATDAEYVVIRESIITDIHEYAISLTVELAEININIQVKLIS